ncbi:putative F-box/LRR-repeat protein 23 [Lotus japonicus]|uniref:putative F-box/LRR-repeat protein 23 n=1 Tax=Lotus japonicus TaxID=34305 RepID=UPI0025876BB1|nr:putative F-box/LRR-repeat protein 23 [Lotus japonicus]
MASNGEITEGPLPNWLELPTEVTAKILYKLGAFDILTSARLVCPLWWKTCKDPLMWRTIDLTNQPPSYPHTAMLKLCRYAIEQSCGHLEDISIDFFCTDEVLKYIADSGSHLRRMGLLMKSWGISDVGMIELVKKLPLLEEFEISFNCLPKNILELIGQSCPFLKVIKFTLFIGFPKGFECNDDAFVIAKTMPELRHLQLIANRLTNDGLLAILDGCRHLESLDLRGCSNVDLSGSLGERCCKQIKYLYLPEDVSEFSYYFEDEEDDGDYDDCYYDQECDWGKEGAYHNCVVAHSYGDCIQ